MKNRFTRENPLIDSAACRSLLGTILLSSCALPHATYRWDAQADQADANTDTTETGLEDNGTPDTSDTGAPDAFEDIISTVDSADVGSDANDAAPDAMSPTVLCGRGIIPGYPLAYNIPTGTTVPAEIATASSRPDGSNIAEINWGDSPVFERVNFDMASPSRALGNHVFTTTGSREAVWRLNGAECGRQSFTVVDGASTRISCSGGFVFDGSDTIRVGESTTVRLNAFPRGAAPGDSPLTYYFGNLPTVSGMATVMGPTMTTRIVATNPPGPGRYVLTGRACSPRGECASCAMPVLTVTP